MDNLLVARSYESKLRIQMVEMVLSKIIERNDP